MSANVFVEPSVRLNNAKNGVSTKVRKNIVVESAENGFLVRTRINDDYEGEITSISSDIEGVKTIVEEFLT